MPDFGGEIRAKLEDAWTHASPALAVLAAGTALALCIYSVDRHISTSVAKQAANNPESLENERRISFVSRVRGEPSPQEARWLEQLRVAVPYFSDDASWSAGFKAELESSSPGIDRLRRLLKEGASTEANWQERLATQPQTDSVVREMEDSIKREGYIKRLLDYSPQAQMARY